MLPCGVVASRFKHDPQQHDTAVQAWSDGFCLTDWYTAKRWVVRRDAHHNDLWKVAVPSMEATWKIAGVVPIYPLCGTNLSPHLEGVREAPGVADNPLAAYARRLAALEQRPAFIAHS